MKNLKTTNEIWAEINARQDAIFALNYDIERATEKIREINLEINQLSKQLEQSLIS
jgi:hypothetical protein